jgi:hypothetical protein
MRQAEEILRGALVKGIKNYQNSSASGKLIGFSHEM